MPSPTLRTAFLMSALAGCDAAFIDQSGSTDLSEAVQVEDDFQGSAGQVAEGAFEGRAGYRGTGTATLVLEDDDTFSLRFSDDFSTSRVPGPVVLLTNRDTVGRSIRPDLGDLLLGPLENENGPQVYPLPTGDGGRRVAWVYCEPFGVEVARAVMTDVQP